MGIARDITGRKLAEAALIKSEKLAAAGRLAATLAHEINNPLQAVTNLMTLLGRSAGLNEQEQTYAAMAEEELARVVHLTQQSLSFYRESIYPAAVNLETALDNVLNLYGKKLLAKEIAIDRKYQSDGSTINSYPGEIRQVFSTLLLNAMEAVPPGGTITIRVRKSRSWNNSQTNGIRVAIADNGIGIPPNNTACIFEPFLLPKGSKEPLLACGWPVVFLADLAARSECAVVYIPAKAVLVFRSSYPAKRQVNEAVIAQTLAIVLNQAGFGQAHSIIRIGLSPQAPS